MQMRNSILFISFAVALTMAAAGPSFARSAPESFADLTAQLSPMVVNISTSQTLRRPNARNNLPQIPEGSPLDDFFKDFLERGQSSPRRVQSLGSGFVIDASGIIVTNNHVIEGADEITVSFEDGTSLPATVVGHDDKTDVAVLRVKPRAPLKVARFGDSDKGRVGDWVIAIGDPFGLGGTVTAGIISARGRDINAGPYDDFIQTDAAINRGNSGGPLFNMDGEVIGINSAIYSPTGGSVGVGFAIPSNLAKSIIAQLRQYGEMRRGWMGVRIQQVTDEIASSLGLPRASGAMVADVTAGGPAAKGGLQNGDLIITYDGRPVPDSRALPRYVADTQIGKNVNVEVVRKGARKIVSIQIARLVDDKPAAAKRPAAPAKPTEKPKQSSRLGLALAALSAETRGRYNIPASVQGVVVSTVDDNSPAGDKNIRPGDVIVEVAQTRVTTPEQVNAKVDAELKAGRSAILLLVSRGGQSSYIGVKLR
jgi:serine protease Do